MPKSRILIVDDSVVVRRMITEALAGDPEVEVAGIAPNGRIALAKIVQGAPDLVILDVEMPEMNGLDTLTEIRRISPDLPVIIFSSFTERGANVTLEALARGASDYVTKPSQMSGPGESVRLMHDELLPKIRILCQRGQPPQFTRAAVAAPSADPASPRKVSRSFSPEAVVIGSSTGGPNALTELLAFIPRDFPLPILIVQHMPPLFTKLLAQRLADKCAVPVREAQQGDLVSGGGVWIAPGDHHMLVEGLAGPRTLRLTKDQPENSCRPAVDPLFRSAAQAYGPNLLGVVLTGMGSDGLRGSEWIREAGGHVYVQDEASSVVWGMPGAVATKGLADRIIPLAEMGSEILRVCLRKPAGNSVASL